MPERLATSSPLFKRLMPLLREKISTFGEITNLFGREGELGFVDHISDYPADLLLWKKDPDQAKAISHLQKAREILSMVSDHGFTADAIKTALWPYAEANGRGDVLWPLRVALTGQERSPDPFNAASILGKTESERRIMAAITKIHTKKP